MSKKEGYEGISEIDHSLLNLDGRTDRQTDDGRFGIRKNSAAFRLAELKYVAGMCSTLYGYNMLHGDMLFLYFKTLCIYEIMS